ncbi:MAG: HNH endonuclease [Candidatus Methylumidiphilus sp.]
MLAISYKNLSDWATTELDAHTTAITQLQYFPDQVVKAKGLWDAKSPTKLFEELKATLARMCSGNQRCMYCEDSFADEIEHRRPKNLYPHQTFDWDNLLYACGPCNSPKGNQFAILSPPFSAGFSDITPKRGIVPVPPPPGLDALIDQRAENPLDLIWLDFNTFRFTPTNPNHDSIEYWKAEYTIKLLRLNARETLVRGREHAYHSFLNSLSDYLRNPKPNRQDEFRKFLKSAPHKTVWEEMKRQHSQRDDLRDLFQQAPEVLAW